MAKVARISIARPDIGEQEKENVRKCIESGWISQGPFVAEAEQRLCAITGRKHAICTSSGTMALVVALLASKHRMDRITVPVPALIFAAVHNAVRLTGGRPFYLGSHSKSWQISASEWSRASSHPVIIAAPNYGKVEGSDVGSDNLIMINDCAESWGGTYYTRPAAAYGTIACVSFFCNKICISGEGGAVLTDSDYFAEQARLIINHGIARKNYMPEPETAGMNGRMNDLEAAILCAQLERMPEMLQRRHQIMSQYRAVAGPEWTFPVVCDYEVPAPWLFAGIHSDVKDVQRRADAANIEWRPFFPIPKEAGEMKETRFISENGICLPLSSTLTDGEVNRVCDVIGGR